MYWTFYIQYPGNQWSKYNKHYLVGTLWRDNNREDISKMVIREHIFAIGSLPKCEKVRKELQEMSYREVMERYRETIIR